MDRPDLSNVATSSLLEELTRRLKLDNATGQKVGAAPSVRDQVSDMMLRDVDFCRPVVISGPSGVGKGTLLNMLRANFPGSFGFSVSHTTRKPRGSEQNGKEYHFVSVEDFVDNRDRNRFLEWAKVHGNYYGTSIDAVNAIRRQRQVPLVEIDVQGAQKLQKRDDFHGQYIFIKPPSFEELERRLRDRGSETEEDIQTRLTNARDELRMATDRALYDVFIVNRDKHEAYRALRGVVQENRAQCIGFTSLMDAIRGTH